MRFLVATLVLLALPALAAAQDAVPERVLQEHQQACMSECTAGRDTAYCAAVCDCVTDQVRQYYTSADFQARTDRLAQNPADPDVMGEVEQITAYCAMQARP